eukprot:350747-Chlamydomonas_euryale.AAC.1
MVSGLGLFLRRRAGGRCTAPLATCRAPRGAQTSRAGRSAVADATFSPPVPRVARTTPGDRPAAQRAPLAEPGPVVCPPLNPLLPWRGPGRAPGRPRWLYGVATGNLERTQPPSASMEATSPSAAGRATPGPRVRIEEPPVSSEASSMGMGVYRTGGRASSGTFVGAAAPRGTLAVTSGSAGYGGASLQLGRPLQHDVRRYVDAMTPRVDR